MNGVYADPTLFNGTYTLIATVLFALQIYCDFSGYSDIAIGIARIMGFDLMINFRQPYFATSITDFWRRWNISLCTWFRDYLYVPLGGNRTTNPMWVRNIMLVFAVSGIWHGASWTFLIWGLWHGAALVIEHVVTRWRAPARVSLSASALATTRISDVGVVGSSLGMAYTLVVVLIGWVFFRALSLHDALYILKSWTSFGPLSYGTFGMLGFASVEILVAATNVLVLLVVEILIVCQPDKLKSIRKNWVLAPLGAVVLFYDIFLFGAFGHHEFIYFQF